MQLSDRMVEEAVKAFNNASMSGIHQYDHDALIAAIEAAIQAAWQTMETAPTDGTCILFVNKLEEYGICWWGREYDSSIKGFNYGWRSDSCEDFGGFETPIYWMELPKRKE